MLLGNVILTRCDLTEIRDPVFKVRVTFGENRKKRRMKMCEAEEKWKKELYDAGYAKGYAEGYAEGLIKGKILGLVERVIEALKEIDSKWRDGDLKEDEEKGRFIGRLEMFVELTKRMMTKSDMTLDDAMAHLGLTDDEKQIVRFCLEP